MNQRNRFPARRRFLKQSAALSAGASLAAPAVLAQVHQPAIKLGLLHAVSGPDAALGRACREAALLALQDVNGRRNARGLPPLLAVCADAALHAQPLAAVQAMHAQGVHVMLALLPEGTLPAAAPDAAPLVVLRLAPAAFAREASSDCAALLQALPATGQAGPAHFGPGQLATAQLAVASSDAAVHALDAVLGGARLAELVRALCDAGLATPLAVRTADPAMATRAVQAVLLVPAAGAAVARPRHA
jgi:hypothetical protein